MLRSTSLILLVASVLVFVACSTTPPPPPPDTRAADVEAVKAVEEAWVKETVAKDADKFVSYFTDDAVALYPGVATLNGKAAIKAAMVSMFGDPNFSITFQDKRFVASKGGDMVYSLGTYTATFSNPKTKKPSTDKGKYLTIYMKQADGTWKVVVDTYNSDSPM